ncbi:MAG: hypothetical protein PVS3B2_17670 [Candidatus Dormibacteraceae bacterium]
MSAAPIPTFLGSFCAPLDRATSISLVRSPIDVLAGRVGGFKKMEIARRTVPCFKHVIEQEGETLAVCLLVDSGRLYRFPFEDAKGISGLAVKARYLRGEMEHLRLREFQPGLCRYVERAGKAV